MVCNATCAQSLQICTHCHEPFEQFWEEDLEEWHWKDAMRTPEGKVHATLNPSLIPMEAVENFAWYTLSAHACYFTKFQELYSLRYTVSLNLTSWILIAVSSLLFSVAAKTKEGLGLVHTYSSLLPFKVRHF